MHGWIKIFSLEPGSWEVRLQVLERCGTVLPMCKYRVSGRHTDKLLPAVLHDAALNMSH